MSPQKVVKIEDYKEYTAEIRDIFLNLSINNNSVDVEAKYDIHPKHNSINELKLKGIGIELIKIFVNENELPKDRYSYKNDELTIFLVPRVNYVLQIISKIDPYKNKSLEGLYESCGIITTQCEAEGFRRICFHPDRPDVLSKYKVRIEANKKKFPILLSNGNKIKDSILNEDSERHEAIWIDPFPKPSYLFALVAGNLQEVKSSYKSINGKKISINLYVEKGDEKYTEHAINSLKKAMRWDEEKYGLEYDLDLYNIVAIRHFNMGAMENKSLNIFNSKLVLADSEIATDLELERIESVIAHEYFHNWTGNRITCRDWFQLSLKEGLTVFRDQSFTADLHSSALKRIEDVSFLRNTQFKEDSGPTSHPVKPKEYISIDNFYTTTIYEKGAEIIRMLQTLLGQSNFLSGIKEYVETYDGSAATTEDFVNSILKGATKNGYKSTFSIIQFNRWYYQAGTPKVTIERDWDSSNNKLILKISQIQSSNSTSINAPLIIPIKLSILNSVNTKEENLIILDRAKQTFIFKNVITQNEIPIVSVFRNFSAPVSFNTDLNLNELIYISENDDDIFSRWDTLNFLTRQALLQRSIGKANTKIESLLIKSLENNIIEYKHKQPEFISKILTIPNLAELELYQNPINPIQLNKAHIHFKSLLGKSLENHLIPLLAECNNKCHEKWPRGKGYRSLIEVIWSLLIINGHEDIRKELVKSITCSSMTLSKSALNALIPIECKERDDSLKLFYNKWKSNPIVLDSWFNIQASIERKNSIAFIERLLTHDLYDPFAPNSIRAVLGGFTKNINSFHSIDGEGYDFLVNQIIDVDRRNPITASRLLKIFNQWDKYIEPNKKMMKKSLNRMNENNLSSNTKEILNLILNQ